MMIHIATFIENNPTLTGIIGGLFTSFFGMCGVIVAAAFAYKKPTALENTFNSFKAEVFSKFDEIFLFISKDQEIDAFEAKVDELLKHDLAFIKDTCIANIAICFTEAFVPLMVEIIESNFAVEKKELLFAKLVNAIGYFQKKVGILTSHDFADYFMSQLQRENDDFARKLKTIYANKVNQRKERFQFLSLDYIQAALALLVTCWNDYNMHRVSQGLGKLKGIEEVTECNESL